MYSGSSITRAHDVVLASAKFGPIFPTGFPDYSVATCQQLTGQIMRAWDEESQSLIRVLTPEEEQFIVMAKLRVIYDVPWYLEVFCYIDQEGHGLRPLYPLWESQAFLLKMLAHLEDQREASGSPDGLLVNILKIRQVGITTLGVCLVAHRILTRSYVRALVGSDVEDQAGYLFRIAERVYKNLPYFLKPRQTGYNKDRELLLSNQSSLKTAWGKSTRGALQEVGGKKGNIGRGKTFPVNHISELATWDNPDQLDIAFFPGIPVSRQVLSLLESTAERAGDWWHDHYTATEKGYGRYVNLFIGAYAVPGKYSLPPPPGWIPAATTKEWVEKSIKESPKYCFGQTIRPTLAQQFWYESTRGFYAAKNRLYDFLKEFPTDPQECFQYAGRGVFSPEQIDSIEKVARPLIDVWACEPSRDIAELRKMGPEDDPKAAALQTDRRPAAPSVLRGVPAAYDVPPGYGFRRLGTTELKDLLEMKSEGTSRQPLRNAGLLIYEYPRSRGARRYTLGVDVGDGLGLDYSAISVVRQPTIEEPAEEVAQYVSNLVKPSQLAFICDAIGRLYVDQEGIEACAAVELNNHGITVQDLLQLHLGYANFYVWEVVDAADPSSRFTRRIGWQTTTRTRPILVEKFHDGVTTIDPLSGIADFRINSPITLEDMRHFITEGLLGEAEHAPKHHDDAIFAAAIGYYVSYRLTGGEQEPIAERRHRRDQINLQAVETGRRTDWRNTAVTAEAADRGEDDDGEDEFSGRDGGLYFDPRNGA